MTEKNRGNAIDKKYKIVAKVVKGLFEANGWCLAFNGFLNVRLCCFWWFSFAYPDNMNYIRVNAALPKA